MDFAQSYYACYYSKTNSGDFPTPLTSGVMAVGFVDTLMSRDDGSAFDLGTVDLAFGPFKTGPYARGVNNDFTTVTGNFMDGSSASIDLGVRYGFQRFTFNWTDLVSVNFGATKHSGYLAFDNIAYDGDPAPPLNTAIPEPATWAMLLTGFFGMGAMMRRNRRALAFAAV